MAGKKQPKFLWSAAALVLVAACDRSGSAEAPRAGERSDVAAPAAAPAGAEREAQGRGMLNAIAGAKPKSLAAAAQDEEAEKRGPTRRVRCQINDEPEQACDFTQVFGDGSFDIEMPDRQLRLIVSGNEAAPFELVGQRRIPIVGLLQRDPGDPACWVSDDPDATLRRVCAR